MRSDGKNPEKSRSAHSKGFSCPQHFASNPGASELKISPHFLHLFLQASPYLVQDPLLMLPTEANVDHSEPIGRIGWGFRADISCNRAVRVHNDPIRC
jgi:hypothetical protein